MASKISAEQKEALKELVVALNKLDEMGAIPEAAFREQSQGIVVSFEVGSEDKEKKERYFVKKREGILDAIFSNETFRAKKQKD